MLNHMYNVFKQSINAMNRAIVMLFTLYNHGWDDILKRVGLGVTNCITPDSTETLGETRGGLIKIRHISLITHTEVQSLYSYESCAYDILNLTNTR